MYTQFVSYIIVLFVELFFEQLNKVHIPILFKGASWLFVIAPFYKTINQIKYVYVFSYVHILCHEQL